MNENFLRFEYIVCLGSPARKLYANTGNRWQVTKYFKKCINSFCNIPNICLIFFAYCKYCKNKEP